MIEVVQPWQAPGRIRELERMQCMGSLSGSGSGSPFSRKTTKPPATTKALTLATSEAVYETSIPAALSFTKTTPFSVSMLVRVDPSWTTSGFALGKQNNYNTAFGWGLMLSRDAGTGNARMVFEGTDVWPTYVMQAYQTSFDIVVDGVTFHHLVWTYSGSGSATGLKFYDERSQITGVTVARDTLTAGHDFNNPTAQLTVGRRIYSSSPLPCPGTYCHLAIWNIALTPAQISAYDAHTTPDPRGLASAANLVSYWPLGNSPDVYNHLYDLVGGYDITGVVGGVGPTNIVDVTL